MSLLIAVIHIAKLLSLARLQRGGTSMSHSHQPSRLDIPVVWGLRNNKHTSLRYSSLSVISGRYQKISNIRKISEYQ